MAEKLDRMQPDVPGKRNTPPRPTQPGGSGKERTDPNPTRGKAQPPYPPYEENPGSEARSVSQEGKDRSRA